MSSLSEEEEEEAERLVGHNPNFATSMMEFDDDFHRRQVKNRLKETKQTYLDIDAV